MRYFCEDCEVPFCPDCSAFSGSHKGHKVVLLSKIYLGQKEKIQQEMLKFEKRIEEMRAKSLSMRMDLQKLLKSNTDKRELFENYIFGLIGQLETEYKEKESLILSRFQTNEEEIELLDSIKDTILSDLENYSQNDVVSRTEEILHLIKSLCERGIEELEIDTNFTAIGEIVPEYQCFAYHLGKFSTLQDTTVYSPGFSFNGCEWKLKIYPKGNGGAKGKFISVFLEMSKGLSSKVKFEYKI